MKSSTRKKTVQSLFPLIILSVVFSLSILFAVEGQFLGRIDSVNNATGEVVAQVPNAAQLVQMGNRLYVRVDGKAVVMKATFPMQTVVKCSVEPKYRPFLAKLGKGMAVYRYVAGVEEKEETPAAYKAGEVKKIGGIEFVYIKGGEFMMGQPDPNIGGNGDTKGEQPVHKVKVSGFWMGKYEVTQDQYQSVMGTNPSQFKGGNLPVENVSWYETKSFCAKFKEKHGVEVRLPYEAEWEYACRAGTSTKYYWGENIDGKYCWYRDNSGMKTHPVGQKLPNAFGLYDMSGNVYEWCEDWYGEAYYGSSAYDNPKGPASGKNRVLRGGSHHYFSVIEVLRSAYRDNISPDIRTMFSGFRLVFSGGK